MDATQAKQALQDWYDHGTAATKDAQAAAQAVARKQALVDRGMSYIDTGGAAASAVPDPGASGRVEALRSWGTRRALD
jgi:hypothetical protein